MPKLQCHICDPIENVYRSKRFPDISGCLVCTVCEWPSFCHYQLVIVFLYTLVLIFHSKDPIPGRFFINVITCPFMVNVTQSEP